MLGLARLVDLVQVSVADKQHNQVVYTASNELWFVEMTHSAEVTI